MAGKTAKFRRQLFFQQSFPGEKPYHLLSEYLAKLKNF
jgi:hypothetical protein